MITLDQIDTSRANESMAQLHDALLGAGRDASNLVASEAVLLGKQIINFTPPIKSNGRSPKASGEMAIDRELRSLFSEAQPQLIDTIGSRFGTSNVNTFITGKNGDKTNLQWANIDPLGARMASFHKKYQNNRGKISLRTGRTGKGTWKARVVVPAGTLEPYIKTVKARVGRGRASFATGVIAIAAAGQISNRAKFPRWITEHEGIASISISRPEGLANTVKPSCEFGSRAPGIDRIGDRIQGAVNFRAKKMADNARYILNNYAGAHNRGEHIKPVGDRHTEPGDNVE